MSEDPVITETQHPRLGPPLPDGEPCPACGSPLAGDQRYCLHCGARRPEARLEFLDVLDADVRARQAGALTPVAPAPVPPPNGLNARLQANAGLLGLAALLSLTLLIGLLVGHWVSDARQTAAPAAAAPAPQVIRVEGAGGGATAAPAATGGGGDAASSAGKAKHKASSSASSAKTATAPKDSVSVKSLTDKKAVDDAVKKGKPISTGTGKLPPKDDKPAAGGSDFEEIG